MDTTNTSIAQERLLATAKPWLVCDISRAQWFKLSASGRTPLPVRLGTRRPVYLLDELQAWLRAGAPDRQTWQRIRGRSDDNA
jgi:predicted DNA-binding transcriptional regulator AlpA